MPVPGITQALAFVAMPPQSVSYLGSTCFEKVPVCWLPLGPAPPPPPQTPVPVFAPLVIAWGAPPAVSSAVSQRKGTVRRRPPSWTPPAPDRSPLAPCTGEPLVGT